MNIELNLTTPALLFPAISLLLLAYTNRFLVLAQLIRQLNARENGSQIRAMVKAQISNLRNRLNLIRRMQFFGMLSFLLCTGAMFAVFLQQNLIGTSLFGLSLICLLYSLIVSLYEIHISCQAIEIELTNIENKPIVDNE
jgi:O-antigen ligase